MLNLLANISGSAHEMHIKTSKYIAKGNLHELSYIYEFISQVGEWYRMPYYTKYI